MSAYCLSFFLVQVVCHVSLAIPALQPLLFKGIYQALKKIQETLALTQELLHSFSLAFAQGWATLIHQLRREERAVRELAEATMSLSTEQGYMGYLAVGTIMYGWALSEQGAGKEGVRQIRQGLTDFQATGTKRSWPRYLALLAEAYGKGRQAEEGLSVLAEALATVNKTGEREYEAELYRLKGELFLQAGVQSPESEACFQKALDVACHQQAKSLELRAATSLAHLWQGQDKRAAAYNLLAPIYNWFTEGFDTKDLQEAQALLEELS